MCEDRCTAKSLIARDRPKTSGLKSINYEALLTLHKTVPLVKLVMVKLQSLAAAPVKAVAVVARAILVVFPAHQVLPVTQDVPDAQENQELPDYQETLVSHQHNHANRLLLHHANHVHKDLQGQLDRQDHQAMLDNQEHQEIPAKMHLPERLDRRDHLAHRDNQDNQDHLENLEPQLNLHRHNQAHLDRQETLDLQGHLDHPGNQETMLDQDLLDQRGLLDHRDHQETMDSQELQEMLDNLEIQERRESVPNTAPSMVEFSSKTELAVVKMEWQHDGMLGVSQLPATIAHFTLLLLLQHKHQKIFFNGNVLEIA